MRRKRTAATRQAEKFQNLPRQGSGDRRARLNVHQLVRYQMTTSPVVLAYGSNAGYLDGLRKSAEDGAKYTHRDHPDPPRFDVVLRSGARGGKGT